MVSGEGIVSYFYVRGWRPTALDYDSEEFGEELIKKVNTENIRKGKAALRFKSPTTRNRLVSGMASVVGDLEEYKKLQRLKESAEEIKIEIPREITFEGAKTRIDETISEISEDLIAEGKIERPVRSFEEYQDAPGNVKSMITWRVKKLR
jgi:hypothetical protein